MDTSQSVLVGGTTAFSTATDTATLTVIHVNNAPVLTPASPSMGTTDFHAIPKIINVSGVFINNGSGTTTITDVDTGAVIGGIAVTGVTGHGVWVYSLDGTNFTAVGTVSTAAALLLPNTAQLRYTPDGTDLETATITYQAWDTTTGTVGATVDLTAAGATGGTTAFSTASDTASLTVANLNHAPVLVAVHPSLGNIAPGAVKSFALTSFINAQTGSTTITDADTGAVVGGIALTGAAGSGTWEYSTDGTTFTAVGTVSNAAALLLPKNATLRYTASASTSDTPSITYCAWDTTTGTSGSKVDLSATTAVGGTTAFSSATDTATLTIGGASLSGYIYFDSNQDGLRTLPGGGTHYGLPGVALQLLVSNGAGGWTAVTRVPPVLSGADGSYHFNNLAAGTYRISETQPTNFVDGVETAGTVGGVARGTSGSDTIDVQLAAGEQGVEYNFAENGLKPAMVTLRMFLASAPYRRRRFHASRCGACHRFVRRARGNWLQHANHGQRHSGRRHRSGCHRHRFG